MTAGNSILSSADIGLFSNVQNSIYWTGEELEPHPTRAWSFHIGVGLQRPQLKRDNNFAWAVRSGDVAAVAVPGSITLFGLGLLG